MNVGHVKLDPPARELRWNSVPCVGCGHVVHAAVCVRRPGRGIVKLCAECLDAAIDHYLARRG